MNVRLGIDFDKTEAMKNETTDNWKKLYSRVQSKTKTEETEAIDGKANSTWIRTLMI